jgi:hypothetical protein
LNKPLNANVVSEESEPETDEGSDEEPTEDE